MAWLWLIVGGGVAVFLACALYGRHLEKHPEQSVIGSQLIEQHGRTVETVTREAFKRGVEQERELWATWLDETPQEADETPDEDETLDEALDEDETPDEDEDEDTSWIDLVR